MRSALPIIDASGCMQSEFDADNTYTLPIIDASGCMQSECDADNTFTLPIIGKRVAGCCPVLKICSPMDFRNLRVK